jgi:hypothetical protein
MRETVFPSKNKELVITSLNCNIRHNLHKLDKLDNMEHSCSMISSLKSNNRHNLHKLDKLDTEVQILWHSTVCTRMLQLTFPQKTASKLLKINDCAIVLICAAFFLTRATSFASSRATTSDVRARRLTRHSRAFEK